MISSSLRVVSRALVLVGLGLPLALASQSTKPAFDMDRFAITQEGFFEPFYVIETKPLRQALDDGTVVGDDRVLVTETAGGRLAVLTDEMWFHHIAEGRTGDRDWMVTFCVVCNTGVSMIPTIDGRMHHFSVAGVYDGVFVMRDAETGTLWNHITGEALYGELVGHRLPVSNLLQMSVRQALALDSDMAVAISDLRDDGSRFDNEELDARFAGTLGEEDLRRPRMDLGIGVWTERIERFYPVEIIRRQGNALIDELDGRNVLVYVDPETAIPAALFVDATAVHLEEGEIRLDNGSFVRSGVLLDSGGERQAMERPQQLFTRWYGFSLTFPEPEVYGN